MIKCRILYNPVNITKLIILTFIVVILLPDFTNTNSKNYNIFIGLDPSLHTGLQLAYENNFNFGNDIIFTYGPLGFLYTKTNILSPNYNFILFGVFQLLIIFYALYEFSIRSKNNLINYLWLLLISLILSLIFNYTQFFLTFFSVAFLLHCLNTKKIKYLYLSYFISLIPFYIKLDSGFPLLILNIGALIPLYFCKVSYKKLIFFVLYATALLSLSAFLLNVNIPNYIIGGFNMIKGYNVAMNKAIPTNKLFILNSAIGVLFGYAIYFIILVRKSKFKIQEIYKCLALFALLFVFYKKGFTRFVPGNLDYCFQGFIIITILSTLFTSKNKSIKLILFFTMFFIFSIKPQRGQSIKPTQNYYVNNCYKHIREITSKVKWDIKNYTLKFTFKTFIGRDKLYDAFKQFNINEKDKHSRAIIQNALTTLNKDSSIDKRLRKSNSLKNFIELFSLPNKFLKKLEDKTVDIFTRDVHYAYYSKLNYNPRPIIQCYAAYTKYLDNLNASFIGDSIKSPDYILWRSRRAFIKKNGIWQSPNTYLNLLENYKYNDIGYANSSNWIILLDKREKPLTLVKGIKKTKVNFCEYSNQANTNRKIEIYFIYR